MQSFDYVKAADFHNLQMDKYHEQQAESYAERVTANMQDLDTFRSFINDIDPEACELQAFHGCMDEDKESKVFAYDILMNLYEEYVHDVTVL